MECWCNNCPRRDDDDVLSSKLSTSRTKQCVQLSKLSRWLRYAWLKLKQVVFANKFWSDKYIHYCSQTTWTTSHQNKSALSECIVWNEGAPSITVKSVRITWKSEYVGPTHLFSLPHRAHAVAENLGTEGPHTYFSVIRLLVKTRQYTHSETRSEKLRTCD